MSMCAQAAGVSDKDAMEARFMLGRAGPIAEIARTAMNVMLAMPSERLRVNIDMEKSDRPAFTVRCSSCLLNHWLF